MKNHSEGGNQEDHAKDTAEITCSRPTLWALTF